MICIRVTDFDRLPLGENVVSTVERVQDPKYRASSKQRHVAAQITMFCGDRWAEIWSRDCWETRNMWLLRLQFSYLLSVRFVRVIWPCPYVICAQHSHLPQGTQSPCYHSMGSGGFLSVLSLWLPWLILAKKMRHSLPPEVMQEDPFRLLPHTPGSLVPSSSPAPPFSSRTSSSFAPGASSPEGCPEHHLGPSDSWVPTMEKLPMFWLLLQELFTRNRLL